MYLKGELTVDANILRKLPEALLPWYEQNKRILPWRQTKDPYCIWLSEVMLQQTRVEAVKGYYARFLEAYPTVAQLAQAEDEHLHKLWEGLGYYSRVRNLKKAAGEIMDRFGGRFPSTYQELLSLPGVGAYTAGAICSIAFDQPVAAVDGNVLRIISRLTEDPTPIDEPTFKKEVKEILEMVYPQEAGAFTQALMELGATLCGPNWKPKCEECPCRDFCSGRLHGTAENFPVKKPKKKRREEKRTVLILSCEGQYALQKRPDTGLLAGLYQFPNVPGWFDIQEIPELVEKLGLSPREILRQVQRSHIFTHIRWDMQGIYMEVSDPVGEFLWFTGEQIKKEAALPTAFRQFWEEIKDV
jgi:A/G-specific adenine glycosylase